MLGREGISLGAFRPAVESALQAQTGAADVDIGDIYLVRDGRSAPFQLRVSDIVLGQEGGSALTVPAIVVRLDSNALFHGRALPKSIEVAGASILVERQDDNVSVDGQLDAGNPLDIGALVASASEIGFEGAYLRDLTLRYRNRSTGAALGIEGANARLVAQDGGYQFRLGAPYAADGFLSLDFLVRPETAAIEATLTVADTPAAVLMPLFVGERADLGLDAPVSGTVTAEGDLTTGIQQMGIALAIGEGELTLGGRPIPVASAVFDGTFDPAGLTTVMDRVQIDVGGNKIDASGAFTLDMYDGALEQIAFELAAPDIVLNPDDLFEAPLPLSDMAANGTIDLARRVIAFDQLAATFFGAKVDASGAYLMPDVPGQSPGITATVAVDGPLSPAEVLRGWPPAMGDGARRWVASGLTGGAVSDVQYKMDIPRGAMSDGAALTEDQLDLQFTARDATVIYVPGMRPIRGLNATGRLAGNSFNLTARGGRVGGVRVVAGAVEMPRLVPKGAPATFTATVSGDVSKMLSVLDEKPLGYMTASGLSADQFSGEGRFTIKVTRPMLSYVPQSDYGFSGNGQFTALEARELVPGVLIDGGDGTVTLTDRGLTISGQAHAEGVPATFTLERRFGAGQVMRLDAQASLDTRAGDALGLPFRRYLNGAMQLNLEADGTGGAFRRLRVTSDLTGVAFRDEDGRSFKSADETGELAFDVDLDPDNGGIAIPSLKVSSGDINIEGNLRFADGGGLVDLDVPRLFLNDLVDMSVRMRRDAEELVIKVEGEFADLTGTLDDVLRGQAGGGLPLPVRFDAQLQKVALRGGVVLGDVRVAGLHNGQHVARVTGEGAFQGGGKVDVEVGPNPSGLGRDVSITTDRFGRVLQGLFGVSSVRGGAGGLRATMLENGPVAGEFTASDIVVQDAPTVARLLSIGSLDGLANVLNGEGLAFEELSGDVQLENGLLRFVNTRLTGSALGISANGDVQLADRPVLALHGAIAPAYQVNSLLGALPGVGGILVSREGEGVFALAYRVDGRTDDVTVSVNSLAALAPGIFRRIFEPVTRKHPTTEEILNAADEAAMMDEARDYLSTPELLREHEAWREEKNGAEARP